MREKVNKDIGFLIKKINDEIGRRANKILKSFDLTLAQSYILGYLHENINRKVSQRELQLHMDVSHPTIAGILTRLEAKGLIKCKFDDEDKRIKNVYLSKNEKNINEAMEIFRVNTERRFGQNLTSKEKKELTVLLNKILVDLKSSEE